MTTRFVPALLLVTLLLNGCDSSNSNPADTGSDSGVDATDDATGTSDLSDAASDATGERVAERPVYPPDVLGSICELMGIDPDAPLPNPRGMDLTVMPSGEEFGEGAGRLTEIM